MQSWSPNISILETMVNLFQDIGTPDTNRQQEIYNVCFNFFCPQIWRIPNCMSNFHAPPSEFWLFSCTLSMEYVLYWLSTSLLGPFSPNNGTNIFWSFELRSSTDHDVFWLISPSTFSCVDFIISRASFILEISSLANSSRFCFASGFHHFRLPWNSILFYYW